MSSGVPGISLRRLGASDVDSAAATLTMMAEVFDEPRESLSHAYLGSLLARADFWLLSAFSEQQPVGGVTAFALPLTRVESTELFIYDLAVHERFQRRGIGRALVQELTALAARQGVQVAWVPADNEDAHALEFYRSLGASESPVTIFTLGQAT